MMKIYFLIFLISQVMSDTCEKYSFSSECKSDIQCQWTNDTSQDKCSNIVSNCSELSGSVCQSTYGCSFQMGSTGFCDQNPPLNCQLLGKDECTTQTSLCKWTSTQDCMENTTGYGCASLQEQDCIQQNNFCYASYTCNNINEYGCSSLSVGNCLCASSSCQYTRTEVETCSDVLTYCTALGSEECLDDSAFCSFSANLPFNCSDRSDSNKCNSLSKLLCQDALAFCDFTPSDCQNIKDCTAFDESTCSADSDCYWDSSEQKCNNVTECSDYVLNDKECQLLSETCTYTPFTCSNKNSFGCSGFSRTQCKANLDYCAYVSPAGDCTSNGACSKLNGNDCVYFQNKCSLSPEKGECSMKDGLNCSGKSSIDCLNFDYCTLGYSGCSDINEKLCHLLSSSECAAAGAKCQESKEGYCSNVALTCPSTKSECALTENCQWVGEIQESCYNSLDCSMKLSNECAIADELCLLTYGGSCEIIISEAVVSGQMNQFRFAIFITLLQLLI